MSLRLPWLVDKNGTPRALVLHYKTSVLDGVNVALDSFLEQSSRSAS
jgi:hypothetical protein